jgi:hypothetical protein
VALICYFISGVGFVAWVIISIVRSIEDRRWDRRSKTSRRQIELVRRPTTPMMAVPKNCEALPVASNSWKALHSFRLPDDPWIVQATNLAIDAILERHFLADRVKNGWLTNC